MDDNILTPQQVFDQAVNHLRKQGEKSVDWRKQCRYRLSKDDRVLACAAGGLIHDDEYQEWMDAGPNNLFTFIIAQPECPISLRERLGPHAHLVRELQYAHDTSSDGAPEEDFSRIAKEHGLQYTRPQVQAC